MTFQAYNTNVPNPPNNPSTDVPLMEVNTNSIPNIIVQDHHAFNDNLGGYHTIIHQDPQASDPAAIIGPPKINQLYVKLYTPNATAAVADTQLFSLTGNGGLSQLTGNSAASDGWVYCAGLLLQWGSVTGLSGSWPTSDQTLTFKDRVVGAIPFPNNCFIVVTTFLGPTSSSTGDISINSKSATTFHWQFSGSSSASFGGFNWFAVGN